MVDGTEFDRWRTEAGEALETARLARGGGRSNWACFLAEQRYIPTRYPDAQPGGFPAERYTSEEADRALVDAELVVEVVDDVWRQLQGPTGT